MRIKGSYSVYPLGDYVSEITMDATVHSVEECNHLIRFLTHARAIFADAQKERKRAKQTS